ncbi:lamin tail domain-containing protein [Tessaracoccus sp. HDW20]|uniref:lamin tail domain-containing protein n=1 Tax=Tessaracoccus coleopterorum TaxID=2714950 RepID=UPI0018D4357A|nr:lamin tail domain-containing protein [Tessaracoccus coleopterorum]NHB83886.1 lamin tail domain-containing protein [Tessaracoccus coleopterorum]
MKLRRTATITAAAALVAGLIALPMPAVGAPPSTLMISAYIEGSSSNKAVEVYNPTDAAIDLTGYRLLQFSNGSSTGTLIWTLSGSLASGGHLRVADSAAVDTLTTGAAHTTSALFNGDDAIQLQRDGAVVDSLGQTGTDPGTAWTGSGSPPRTSPCCARRASPTPSSTTHSIRQRSGPHTPSTRSTSSGRSPVTAPAPGNRPIRPSSRARS